MATPTPEQVIRGYNNAVFEVRTRVENFARVAWSSAGSWREADVDRLVAQIVPKVQAGQIRTAQLTAAYLASLQTIRSGARVAAVAVDRELVVAARGVAAEDIYRRPAATMYASLSKGASLTTAVGAGLNRLQSLVATDHQLAKTAQARRSLGRSARSRRHSVTEFRTSYPSTRDAIAALTQSDPTPTPARYSTPPHSN